MYLDLHYEVNNDTGYNFSKIDLSCLLPLQFLKKTKLKCLIILGLVLGFFTIYRPSKECPAG